MYKVTLRSSRTFKTERVAILEGGVLRCSTDAKPFEPTALYAADTWHSVEWVES